MIERLMIGLLGKGHILLEGVPGLAKTLAINSLSSAVKGSFSRIQFTPDLLPADVTGTMIYNMKEGNFSIKQGPVFANFVLADEINRAPAKVQSALLEAMQEKQVTIGDKTFKLSDPFLVMATQNPVEQEGTYPLPEAQLDRFAMKLSIGYPATDDEILMLQEAVGVADDATPDESSILSAGQLRGLQQQVAGISVAKKVQEYLVRIATETRRHASIALGLSPRGLLTLQRAAQARAFLSERGYVTPDDVLDVVEPVLGVRLGLELVEANRVIQDVLEAVAVPEYSENVK